MMRGLAPSLLSTKGDSGSITVGGLFFGDSGATVSTDIAYATPTHSLLVEANSPKAHLNPQLA